MAIEVREVRPGDEAAWRTLFEGYRAFYRLADDRQVIDRTWQWVIAREHGLTGLVAVADDAPVGLAHLRLYARPSAGRLSLFLDDLFVSPDSRGQGAATALLRETAVRAADAGADVVRWITAADNAAARRVYDRVAEPLPFGMYQMPPADGVRTPGRT